MLRSAFKNRTVGFYIGLTAAVIALVGAILYIAIDASDRTFSLIAFILMLVGVAAELLVVFTDLPFMPVVSAGLYIAGFSLTLNAALPSVSDVWNGVNFIGGNATLGIIFSVTFLVCALAGIVSCFLSQRCPADSTKA